MINYFKNLGSLESPYWEHSDKDKATHFNHALLVYGDYCNTGAVGRANVESILAMTELCQRVGVIELHEHYNTTSIMFPIAALEDTEVIEILGSLNSYPVLDEDLMGELEREAAQEAWESYGRREFIQVLAKLGVNTEDLEDDRVDALMGALESESNYGIGSMDGDSWYYNWDRMGGLTPNRVLEVIGEL